MKTWAILFFGLLSMVSAANAKTFSDARYFQISSIEVKEIGSKKLSLKSFNAAAIGSATCGADAVSPFMTKETAEENPGGPQVGVGEVLDAITGADLIFDQVVNLGKKIWNLIDAGKPVVNLKTDVATALPLGAKCWLDMELWQEPQSVSYLVSLKNGYGMEVVHFVYRVVALAGGSKDGRGAYIGYATVEPAAVKVSWGFKFNAQVSVPTTYNLGTKENPVGGLTMSLNYKIEPILGVATIEATDSFRINGRGEIVKLN